MIKHYNIRILGQVQGVGFRYYGQAEAERLGLAGWIANQPDSSVYIEAEGTETALKEFLNWCQKGPRWAQVAKVEVSEGESIGYNGFTVE